MRIVTWNVNGIKTLPQYHPWNKCKTYEAILDELGGDITCIQETKIQRSQLDAGLAQIPTYDSFYSFYRGPSNKPKGIHGTCIFTKRATTVPVKAEEGLSSCLVPSTVANADRIGGYSLSSEVDLSHETMKTLDSEGRTTVCDFGMFVIINLYAPNLTNEDRIQFKNDFNKMVHARVRNLVKQGREVIVVGDLNICRDMIDCANPEERMAEADLVNFTDTTPRKWLNEITGPNGVLIDTTRRLHPHRKGMFTCWNTKIDARPANFGTRLDYILVTPGLLPWLKDADIQAAIYGSDHCPVFLDLHDELPGPTPDAPPRQLWDLLNPGRRKGDKQPDPPKFAARFLEQFSQKGLASFFVKREKATVQTLPSTAPAAMAEAAAEGEVEADEVVVVKAPPATAPAAVSSPNQPRPKPAKSPSATQPKSTTAAPKPAQRDISSFFTKPTPKPSSSQPPAKRKKSLSSSQPVATTAHAFGGSTQALEPIELDSSPPADGVVGSKDAVEPGLGESEDDPLAGMSAEEVEQALEEASASAAATASAWSGMFKPKPVPRCPGHGEPAKQWTVNKPGLNKGRKFYLCARPVGAANDPSARCDYFAWDTSVKRPAAGGASGMVGVAKKAKA